MVGISKVEKAILGEIYSSSEAMENLAILCDEYGGRLAGSEENRGAAEFILSKYEEYGFEDPHLESFKFPGDDVVSSELEIVKPKMKKLSCLTLPSTVSGEVVSDIIYLEHGYNFEEQKDDIDGKIVMMTNRTPLIKSVLAGAVGFIWMHPFPMMGPPTGHVASLVPSVGIKHEDGLMLNRFKERYGDLSVRIKTECRHYERESWNVCGEIPGNGTSDEFIMYGGHYDGHEIAQGAFDCGAPCMASLEVGRVLNNYREHLDRNVRIVLFSSEEFGCWGSKDYAKRHAKDMKKMRFTYQLDCTASGGTQMVSVDYWPQLEPFFERLRDDMNIEMPILQRAGPGDSRVFFGLGIPTGCIRDSRREAYSGRLGILSTVRHTYYDTFDKIDPRSLREAVAIGAISGYRMVNAEDWPKHRTQEEIQALPAVQAAQETLELNKKLKAYLLSKKDELWPETIEWLKHS
jgi:hypothetical protein